MQIHELPSGVPTTDDLVPFDTGDVNYKTPFSGFDIKDNNVTFTTGDNADPSTFQTVDVISTGTLKSVLQKITTMAANVRYTWKFIGQTVMGTVATTITGAIKEIVDKLGDTAMGTDATTITGAISEIRGNLGLAYSGTTSPSSVSVPSGAASAEHAGTMLSSLTLQPGLYISTAWVRFPASSTGSRRINIASTSGSGAYDMSVSSAGQEDTALQLFEILTVQTETTFYLNCWQNSGSAMTVSHWRFTAVRLV